MSASLEGMRHCERSVQSSNPEAFGMVFVRHEIATSALSPSRNDPLHLTYIESPG
jgi:hypothetical protein